MTNTSQTIDDFADREYQYGWTTAVEEESAPPGLSEEIVRWISQKKEEPDWLLEWRLKALRHFFQLLKDHREPEWANVHYPPIDLQAISYYAAPKQKLELASRLAAEPILLQIMELAGNWFGDALQQRRQRQRDGTPDGIEFGRDLPRMLGSELATLADPDLEDLWLHRYSTRTLQQYRQGSTPCKRGPVVVCVDTSGSMDEFEVASKALAIAAAKLAQRDRRPVRVILFSCDIEIYDAPQPMAGAPWLEFLTTVAHSFSGGGTDFDLPLEAALETITSHELYRRADLVFITDGDCEVSYDVEKLLANEKKKRGFGLYTIFLDRAGCESLEALSDEVWTALDSESGLELLAGVA